MPTSYQYFKEEARDWFLLNVPVSKRILDVGPGVGTYSDLLRKHGYKIDAIEIWAPYIAKFQLAEKYDQVFNGNIVDFDFSNYDFIILGDVLEHLSYQQATALIQKIKNTGKECLVAVPYLMPQDEHEGNPFEKHAQSDLTREVMVDRYPDLQLLFFNSSYGYYHLLTKRVTRAYVLYATESYADTVQGCVHSINAVSNIPVFVYMLNSNTQIGGATTINWKCSAKDIPQKKFVDRSDPDLYRIMIERPAIVIDVLTKYADTVAYVDADSVATKLVDKIFDMYHINSLFPYFVEGIYDFLQDGYRGAVETVEDLPNSLEYHACQLFDVDQTVRLTRHYRQTGYFVAGIKTIPFLQEWYWMCQHPFILQNPVKYATFHEETILNVLLWKKDVTVGLPYIYVNATFDNFDKVKDYPENSHISEWVKTPKKENLLFYHGEKDMIKMVTMAESKKNKMRVLYIAPHLSTGGMPAFLLKRLESLLPTEKIHAGIIEFSNYSDEYTVQKDKIYSLGIDVWSIGADKLAVIDVIKKFNPDIIHIDEMIEGFDSFNQVPIEVMNFIYSSGRKWRVIETCHNIVFNPDIQKFYHPDAYAFCTPYHLETFVNMPSRKDVILFPIDNKVPNKKQRDGAKAKLGFDKKKKHVINIGLWTPGKNQKEGLEIARKYPDMHFHFVGNQAVNFKDYWEPLMKDIPENVTVWGERNDIDTFLDAADIFMFNSTFECNPIVLREAISHGLPIVAHDLPQYLGMFDDHIHPMDVDFNSLRNPQILPGTNTSKDFAGKHLKLYMEVMNDKITEQVVEVKIINHYVDGPYLEIIGNSPNAFVVTFYDEKREVQYRNVIKANHWVKLNRKYFTRWRVIVEEERGDTLVVIYDSTLNLKGKRVYISFESSSLGDTIAWMPYVLEFKKKHDCHVIVSTFKNFLFEKMYPELEFITPGNSVDNLFAMYRIGWFYDSNREPQLPNTIPLQQAATNILGLEYHEQLPRIAFEKKERKSKFKFVTIATNSTAGCKFWVKEEWQKLVDELNNRGYKVVNISKERNDLNGVFQIQDSSLESVMDLISHCEFFIGLSSGLSWLAWAMQKPVVMISNFTQEDHEFKCIRITNKSVCHGCWNNPEYTFDKADWNWCPVHKGTPRQFECHTSIKASEVLSELERNSLL